MARTRKSIQPLNLYKYDVLIEDKTTRSEYFKISQFDGYFYGGRNAFLIAGSSVLRPTSKILVEILNSEGTTIFSAPVSSYIEGSSRLIQAEVYEDTPIGIGKIVILGSTDSYIDGTPVPEEWRGKYNVRWTTNVTISPLIENKTPIRFITTPSVVVEEKFYYAPSASQYVKSQAIPLDVRLTPKYLNIFPNGYLVEIVGPETSSKYESKYLGSYLTGSIAINNFASETASIYLPVTKIYTKKLALSEGSLIYTNKDTLILEGFISSSGSYTSSIKPFGTVGATGSLSLEYSELLTENTGSATSFAKIRLVDLRTISGEIYKVKISYKPSSDPGEYSLLGEVRTGVTELLSVDSASRVVSTGIFKNIDVETYWYNATMSLERGERNPIIPSYYNSSSLISESTFADQIYNTVLDSINATPLIVDNKFIDQKIFFIGTRNNNLISLFPRSEYTLAFDAFVSRTSESINLDQKDYSLEVYIVPESGSGGKLLETNPLGQLIGTLTPTNTFQKQNFERVEFNFTPKINLNGNFGLRFVIYGGIWNIANVSVKTAEEPLFSSDELNILLPNTIFSNTFLTFKAEYLDINNNSIRTVTFSEPTFFVGSPRSIEGLNIPTGSGGTSISSSYATTASYAVTVSSASYVPGVATIAFNINGGLRPITTGFKGTVRMPTNVTISKVAMYTNDSGSIDVDIVRQVHSTYDPSVSAGTSIVGTPLAISNDIKYFDNMLSGWTTNLNTDDILNFVVKSVSGTNLKIATVIFNIEK